MGGKSFIRKEGKKGLQEEGKRRGKEGILGGKRFKRKKREEGKR